MVAAVLANQGFDFGDILYEELHNVQSINKTNSSDVISTVSYVEDVKKVENNHGMSQHSTFCLCNPPCRICLYTFLLFQARVVSFTQSVLVFF